MGRPIGVEKKKEILALLAEGHTCSEVGRRAEVDRHTVKKLADDEVDRVAAEQAAAEKAGVVDALVNVPAARLSEVDVVKLQRLLEFVEFLACECGLRLPHFAHVAGEQSLTCLRCGQGWNVTTKRGG